MFEMTVEVEFAAAHALTKLPPTHKCHRKHGHNYKAEVTIVGESLDECDMLVDFGVIRQYIRDRYDHQDLNDFEEFNNNPTAEKIACAIGSSIDFMLGTYKRGLRCVSCSIREKDNAEVTWYRGEPQ